MRNEIKADKETLSLRQEVARMRQWLTLYEKNKPLAVLDALMCARPYPPANNLVQLLSPNSDNSPFTSPPPSPVKKRRMAVRAAGGSGRLVSGR